MDIGLSEAAVKGAFSIGGSVATLIVKHVLETNILESMTAGRRKALSGIWKGTVVQPSLTAQMVMRLSAARKIVKGTADLHFAFDGLDRHLSLNLVGGFLHEKFLKLDYEKDNGGTIQFGSLVAAFSDDGNALDGKYVGYGSITKQIVSGVVALVRQS